MDHFPCAAFSLSAHSIETCLNRNNTLDLIQDIPSYPILLVFKSVLRVTCQQHSPPPQNYDRTSSKHKTQIETQNAKLNLNTESKYVMRGRTGDGVIFKFYDDGPWPGGLKGCAIRRYRGYAMPPMRDHTSENNWVYRMGTARRAPANKEDRQGGIPNEKRWKKLLVF